MSEYFLNEIAKLKEEIERLNEVNLDLLTELNNSRYKELLECIRTIKESAENRLKEDPDEFTKEELLKNLITFINEFAEVYHLDI